MRAPRARIHRRVDRRILSRFGVAISENYDPGVSMTGLIDSFKTLARAGFRVHAGVWPPATRTPITIRLWHAIADEEIVGWTLNVGALKPWTGVKPDPAYGDASPKIRPEAVEITVDAVADLVAVERPDPRYPVLELLALDRRAMEKVRLISGIADHGGPPPVGQGCRRIIILILITVRGKDVAVFIGIKLHEQTDLFEIVFTGNSIRLALSFGQSRQQHRGKDRDDRDDHEQFDQRKTPAIWKNPAQSLH